MQTNFPELSNDFFAVCQTAIKAAAWKYEDFARVKAVEGELERLRQFNFALPISSTTQEFEATTGQIEEIAPEMIKDTTLEQTHRYEAPVAKKPSDNKILTPTEAKEAPIRQMPDDIRELVEAGIEVSKNPPKVRDVKVSELPTDPDAARNEFNKPF